MNISVIGGSGFLGTRLCSRLHHNQNIIFTIHDKCLSKKFPSRTNILDVRYAINPEYFADTDVIINLAAEHRDNVLPISLYHETNVQGAINICEVARINSINKIIFTSSVAVYGFAEVGTDESGTIAPFNEYGKTKAMAEEIYRKWQSEDPSNRVLVIIRPTVIFGEGNRGNVYNLMSSIFLRKFIMIGNGFNRKSLAYVENVAAFLEYSLFFKPDIHIFNYVDKPDFNMNDLIRHINFFLARPYVDWFRLPYIIGIFVGLVFDFISLIFKLKSPISSIRVKKFCANSVYESRVFKTEFVPPIPLFDALKKTISYEFINNNKDNTVFYTE